jgi:hypothetical protein
MVENEEFEDTPQHYGFPEKPTVSNLQCWNRQELFLSAYKRLGQQAAAAREVGISISAVERWLAQDIYGFKKRTKLAQAVYVESVEELMDERLLNPTGNRGSDILLMFKLKAEAPEKYREEVKVLGTGAPLQILDKLRELGAKEIKERELESPAIEGEFKEVGATEGAARPPAGNPPPVSDQADSLLGGHSKRSGNPSSRPPDAPPMATPQPPKKPQREPGRVKRR